MVQSWKKLMSKLGRPASELPAEQVGTQPRLSQLPGNEAATLQLFEPVDSPNPPASANKRNQRYGLFLLKESEPSNDARDDTNVDIVAIHGLNGDAYTTWEHENGVLWLRDLLPNALPGSRIFTYGYPADIFFNKSVANLRDYGRHLLASLRDVLEEDVQRPIIFVCHSLGGIVCKQAIVLAHEENRLYGEILSVTTAIVFLGTPHRGAHGTPDIGKAIGAVINACSRLCMSAGFIGMTRTDLLETLTANSEALKDLATSFRNRLENVDVVTFYETEPTPPLKDLLVDKQSAIMDIANEEVVPLYANHVSMCKFEGQSLVYDSVSKTIRRLARKALRKTRSAKMVLTKTSDRSLNEIEKSCMGLLHALDVIDYKANLPKPVQGTCSWILSNPQYKSWLTKQESMLLWITGNPGCGKTILSAYLSEHLNTHVTQFQYQVCFFFCDDTIMTQRDAKSIIRSILHQILQQHHSLIRHVKSRYDIDGPSIANSFPTLWEIFLKIIGDSSFGPVGVIVDAIDECEQDTRRSFLNAVTDLVHKCQGVDERPRNYVKFLITSRPSLGDSYNFNGLLKSRLPIENNQSYISRDLRLVIKSKVQDIVRMNRCSEETRAFLEQILSSKADQTFLWVDVVLRYLEGSFLASKKDFERIINTFPRDLEATYKKYLQRIPYESRVAAAKILRILVGSSRHLNLKEFNIAFTIQPSHRIVVEVEEDFQPSIARTLQGVVGPFARVSGSQVSLIHQTAKDFLLSLAQRREDPLAQDYGVHSAEAALNLACFCIWYLSLEDFSVDFFSFERTSFETPSTSSPVSTNNDRKVSEIQFDPLGLEEDVIFRDERVLEAEACSHLAQRYDFFDYSATHWCDHLSVCENIAPQHIQDAALRLIEGKDFVLTNWLKYFWIKRGMEYAFPEYFDTVIVAAFFNLSVLLQDSLQRDRFYDPLGKDRALFWAARMGCASSVMVLLRHGGNPNCRVVDQQNALTVAAQHGHLDVARALLAERHTEVNSKGSSGRSALSFAAGNGYSDIVQLLLNHERCQPDNQDNSHWTPLVWAVGANHADIVVDLMKHQSVDVNHTDKQGRSAISWAAGDGLLKSLRILLKYPKTDVNLKDGRGRSPLSWAAGNGHTKIVSLLMCDSRIDRSTKDVDERYAISWACQGGHADTVRTLIKFDCPGIDDEDKSGWTPLAWALNRRSLATVETLLSRVTVDRPDRNGRTALSWAASYGYKDIVQLLVIEGASVQARDKSGRTPLDWAKMYSYNDVIEVLEARLVKEKSRPLVEVTDNS